MSLEKKLNICIVSREYPPETLWGGIGTFTYNLAQGLKNIGHNVDVIAFTLGEDSIADDNGVIIHRISSPKVPFSNKTYWDYVGMALTPFAFFYSRKIQKKIRELEVTKHFDVIDFPEHIGEGFFSVIVGTHPSLVRLYTPLSLIGHLGLNRSTNWLDYFLFGLMEKISIKKCTIVNSPSKALADLVKAEFNVKKDIHLIYNPIDTDKFSPNSLASDSNDEEVVNVLFVGRLSDRKGVHILAKAIPGIVAEIESVQFTIIGTDDEGVDGFNSMKDFMSNVFEEAGVMKKISFGSFVPYDDLPNVYSRADISVVPSLYDNSPYTCLEAMSCGLPVIGASAGGMPEYIDDGVNGIIIPPNNIESLAAAVIRLSTNVQERKDFSEKAREKAVREFKREVVAIKITELYIKAIEVHRSN